MSWFDQITGKKRLAVARIFVHFSGTEIAPILGILNSAAQEAIDYDGDLQILGQQLVRICEIILQNDVYLYAVANEGNVFWNEGESGDYFNELFTDSASRYLSEIDLNQSINTDEPLTIPVTKNLIIMMSFAYEGEDKNIETDLADLQAFKSGLKSLINLHYQERLRAVGIHFSPAQFGDQLTDDQVLQNFTELIPL
jgi:Protein of unknown function (DUF1517)